MDSSEHHGVPRRQSRRAHRRSIRQRVVGLRQEETRQEEVYTHAGTVNVTRVLN